MYAAIRAFVVDVCVIVLIQNMLHELLSNSLARPAGCNFYVDNFQNVLAPRSLLWRACLVFEPLLLQLDDLLGDGVSRDEANTRFVCISADCGWQQGFDKLLAVRIADHGRFVVDTIDLLKIILVSVAQLQIQIHNWDEKV